MCDEIFCDHSAKCSVFDNHSKLRKNLIKSQSLWMGPLQEERALLGGPEYVFWEILANGAGQKKIKIRNQTP